MVTGARLPLAALALAALGIVIGLRLAGASSHDTVFGRVALELQPAIPGGVEAFVPVADWGLRAPAFDGPFELRLELRSIDREALIDAAGGDRSLLAAARDDLRHAVTDAIVRALVWIVVTTVALAALALLAWRPRRPRAARFAGLSGAALAALAGGGILLGSLTFSEAALETPTYTARGAELERLLAAAEEERVRSGYGSELESVLRGLSTVLAEAPVSERRDRKLFVASDLHANALVIDPLARYFDGAPVLMPGDFAQRGTRAEAALVAPRVAALGDRVIAVSGNHDSAAMMERLEREGVVVLGGEPGRFPAVIEAEGLTVAGFSDPLERSGGGDVPAEPVSFDDFDDPAARLELAEEEVRDWFDALPEPPDVVMIHQNQLAQSLAGSLHGDAYDRPLTIVTGHDHRQHVDRYGSITVVDAGTVGAGGIFDAGVAFAGLAGLHFDRNRPALRSVDLIAVEPFSGRGQGSRVVIDALCPEEDRCSYEPSEPEVRLPEDVSAAPG